jgi:hypothetical protein
MGKPPVNTPSVGDRVRLRGRQAWGQLKSVSAELWAQVDWATDGAGPRIVHLHELEKA